MDINKPIFWHQGLFLQPQHFQMEDLYLQSLLAPFHRFQQPHFWGAGSLEIRESALASKIFDLYSGEFIFPDGTYVVFPGNAYFQGRSFDEVYDGGDEPLTAYLALRKWNPGGNNVTVVPRLEDAGEITTRFVTTTDPEEMADLYQEGTPAQMRRLDYVIRIFWSTEREDVNDYDLIPLAQLELDGKEVVLSDHFITPCVSMEASPRLSKLVRNIRDQITTRCGTLEEFKRAHSLKSGDFEMGDYLQLLGLRTLGRCLPALQHLTEAPDIHPWTVYGILRQLVGELTSFSETLTATGEMPDGSRVIPQYDHRSLHACFSTAQNVINHLLDEIVLGGENVIRLRKDGNNYVGEMRSEAFDPRFQYCLVLRTESKAEGVVDTIKTVAKLSSRESIEMLTQRFVGGIPLEYMPYPPPGVPRLSHAVYFRIDHTSPLWNEVEETGGVALHWDMAPEDLTAEIVIQRKA